MLLGTAMDKVGFAFDWWLQHKTPEKPYLFYPKSFKSKNAAGLHEYYANRLGAVEINTTHYHYLPPHTYKSWAKLAGNYPESVGGYDLIIKANKDFTYALSSSLQLRLRDVSAVQLLTAHNASSVTSEQRRRERRECGEAAHCSHPSGSE
jgi:uncharacterized protein YecE (DUF72 family)